MAKKPISESTQETKDDSHPPYKKLYRLPKSGQVAGVCAGLSEYLEMDVTLIRAIFVILALASAGFGVLIYLILAVIIPVNDSSIANEGSQNIDIEKNINTLASEISNDDTIDRLKNMLGIGLVLLGIWLLLVQLFPQWISMNWDVVWPALLIVIGLAFLARSRG